MRSDLRLGGIGRSPQLGKARSSRSLLVIDRPRLSRAQARRARVRKVSPAADRNRQPCRRGLNAPPFSTFTTASERRDRIRVRETARVAGPADVRRRQGPGSASGLRISPVPTSRMLIEADWRSRRCRAGSCDADDRDVNAMSICTLLLRRQARRGKQIGKVTFGGRGGRAATVEE